MRLASTILYMIVLYTQALSGRHAYIMYIHLFMILHVIILENQSGQKEMHNSHLELRIEERGFFYIFTLHLTAFIKFCSNCV